MADFEPITTQEEYQTRFNSDLGDRLKKNEEKWAKKFEGFLSPTEVESKTADFEKQISELTLQLDEAKKQIDAHSKTVAEKDAQIKSFEIQQIKNRIALESGLTHDAIGFIQGEDEDSIRTSAEALKSLVGSTTSAHPFKVEPKIDGSASSESVRKLVQNLKPN